VKLHGVGVVGSSDGIVVLKLRGPHKVFSVAILGVECEQLCVSLAHCDGGLAALSEASQLPVSPHVPFCAFDEERAQRGGRRRAKRLP
jgi:hypothetical protein